METKVMKPSPAPAELNMDSSCTSPYMSAPGSPQPNIFFFSAPTTPSRFTPFHRSSGAGADAGDSPSSIPFKWEDKPGIPKSKEFSDDFEFHFQSHVSTSLSAEDFFDCGQIKPLKPPPRLQFLENGTIIDAPKSPRSPISVKILKEVLSPRNQKNDFDPFAAAIKRSSLEQETHDSFELTSSSANRNKKWKLKNLFVFGRADEEDSLKEYALLSRNRAEEDVKNLRFEPTENRAGSEELKRKTSLPYKKGLFGCLGFNQAVNVNHKITRAIGSISRGP